MERKISKTTKNKHECKVQSKYTVLEVSPREAPPLGVYFPKLAGLNQRIGETFPLEKQYQHP